MISLFSTDKLEVTASPEMPWTLDGEYQEGAENIIIENLQSAISIITPSNIIQEDE
jgi:diacylglycerol kinase family enzyme